MTTRPVAEQVIEAVTRALELMAAINATKGEILLAKQAEDTVRLTNKVPAVEKEAAAKLQEVTESAHARYQATVAEAAAPWNEAQAIYNRKVAEAETKKNTQIEAVKERNREEIAEARRRQELLIATAKAEIHTAEKKAADIQVTLDNYRRQVQAQLGIDLNALVVASG